jgi:hypothetical protein
MANEPLEVLFYATIAPQEPVAYVQATSGPAADRLWEIDVLYICSQASSEVTISLKQLLGGTDEIFLLHGTNILAGETVTIGPLGMINAHSIEAMAVGGDIDVIAYGRELTVS